MRFPSMEFVAEISILNHPSSSSPFQSSSIKGLPNCAFPSSVVFLLIFNLQFPIDVNSVEKDHPFLDPDSLQSLFRRLQALNKCAAMKIDAPAKQQPVGQSSRSSRWTIVEQEAPKKEGGHRIRKEFFSSSNGASSLAGDCRLTPGRQRGARYPLLREAKRSRS
ncbi:unnamed protein product [Nezara viridula]|uniref:Uncharacterized protein n=1 Tax=Nezara viridula TaxID=85310 RepID=A0A9P0E836_NEZVI|nr:unnamed protein product [Nezara viridula]